MAHTLLSTNPVGRATSRTVFSVMSVARPDARLGQAIHRPPSTSSAPISAGSRRSRSRRSVWNDTMTPNGPRACVRTSTPAGRSGTANPSGAASRPNRSPSAIPNFRANGVPE
jgi:hypothetical protein